MITLTDKGAEKVREFLESQSAVAETAGLRVGVRGGGCSGFQYALAFDEQREGDSVFEDKGIRLLVDTPSLPYVRGLDDRLRRRPPGRRLQGRQPQRDRRLWLWLLLPRRGGGGSLRRLTATRHRLRWERRSASATGTGTPANVAGASGSAMRSISAVSGGAGSPYTPSNALRMPRSPTGNTSGRWRWNIRNMSALHRPIPLMAVEPRGHLLV